MLFALAERLVAQLAAPEPREVRERRRVAHCREPSARPALAEKAGLSVARWLPLRGAWELAARRRGHELSGGLDRGAPGDARIRARRGREPDDRVLVRAEPVDELVSEPRGAYRGVAFADQPAAVGGPVHAAERREVQAYLGTERVGPAGERPPSAADTQCGDATDTASVLGERGRGAVTPRFERGGDRAA